MSNAAPAILSYGRVSHTRRRIALLLLIVAIALATVIYWRHAIWRPVSLRWHQFQLERAYRAALAASVPNDRLAVDFMNRDAPAVDRRWQQAWRRMASEYDAVQTGQGFSSRASGAYWNVPSVTPLLIAPMKTPSDEPATIVVLAGGGDLMSEVWIRDSQGQLTRSARRGPDLTIQGANSPLQRKFFTGSFDPTTPSTFTITCEIDGRRHELVGSLSNILTISYGAEDGWVAGDGSFAYFGNNGVQFLNLKIKPLHRALPDATAAATVLPDGKLLAAGLAEWFIFPDLWDATPQHIRAPGSTEKLRAPVSFSPLGSYLLAGNSVDGWHVIDTSSQRVVYEVEPQPLLVPSILTQRQLFLTDKHGQLTVVDLANATTRRAKPRDGVLLSVSGNRALFADRPSIDSMSNPTLGRIIRIIDLAEQRHVASFELSEPADDGLSLSPDGKFLAHVGGLGGRQFSIRSATEPVVRVRNQTIPLYSASNAAVWSADGRWIAFHDLGDFYLLNSPKFDHCWTLPMPVPGQRCSAFGISPDGRWLYAVTRADATVWLWDLDDVNRVSASSN